VDALLVTKREAINNAISANRHMLSPQRIALRNASARRLPLATNESLKKSVVWGPKARLINMTISR
jgi:hypothetical protein